MIHCSQLRCIIYVSCTLPDCCKLHCTQCICIVNCWVNKVKQSENKCTRFTKQNCICDYRNTSTAGCSRSLAESYKDHHGTYAIYRKTSHSWFLYNHTRKLTQARTCTQTIHIQCSTIVQSDTCCPNTQHWDAASWQRNCRSTVRTTAKAAELQKYTGWSDVT